MNEEGRSIQRRGQRLEEVFVEALDNAPGAGKGELLGIRTNNLFQELTGHRSFDFAE